MGPHTLGQVLVQFMMVWQRYRENGSCSLARRSSVKSSLESIIQRYAWGAGGWGGGGLMSADEPCWQRNRPAQSPGGAAERESLSLEACLCSVVPAIFEG